MVVVHVAAPRVRGDGLASARRLRPLEPRGLKAGRRVGGCRHCRTLHAIGEGSDVGIATNRTGGGADRRYQYGGLARLVEPVRVAEVVDACVLLYTQRVV